MARIQILELPTEHHGDDMNTPFVLIVDQVGPELPASNGFVNDGWRHLKEDTGARCVFITTETVEIPANSQ